MSKLLHQVKNWINTNLSKHPTVGANPPPTCNDLPGLAGLGFRPKAPITSPAKHFHLLTQICILLISPRPKWVWSWDLLCLFNPLLSNWALPKCPQSVLIPTIDDVCSSNVFFKFSIDRKAPAPAPAPPTEAEPATEVAPPPPHAPPPHQQPPPLPHRPPPPPPSNYLMSTTSSYMSGEGFQSLQSMMKTEGPTYAPMPPTYATPMPPYHVYPPPTAPPPGPPPPTTFPPPSLPPTYPPPGYNSYPPPPPPRMPPGHVPPPGIGLPPAGYPPPPPVPPGQSQVPLPPPPGMPMNRGGWMRWRRHAGVTNWICPELLVEVYWNARRTSNPLVLGESL